MYSQSTRILIQMWLCLNSVDKLLQMVAVVLQSHFWLENEDMVPRAKYQ